MKAATVIDCDKDCGAQIIDTTSKSHAQRRAREAGWFADKYLVLCPDCRDRRN